MAKDYTKPFTTPYYKELETEGVKLPAFLTHIRTDEARITKPTDSKMFRMMFLTPRVDGCCGTIDTNPNSNLIMIDSNNKSYMEYHKNPTKEQLLEYFSNRIAVRKMHFIEAYRLMDVSEEDIQKLVNAEEVVTLKNGTTKIKKAISKTAHYKLAGNSIVVSCLYHIFKNLFLPNSSDNKPQTKQYTIFDYL